MERRGVDREEGKEIRGRKEGNGERKKEGEVQDMCVYVSE